MTLAGVAGGALLTLLVYAWWEKEPPAWAQPALFSILTAAVAFLFGEGRTRDE